MQLQAPGIDLGPARQVVERPETVPDLVRRQFPADKERADPGHGVLGCTSNDRLPVPIEHLVTLALADRVVTKHRHAVPGEQNACALIAFVGLAVVTVAARHEHSGERRLSFGDIEIGRDVVIGPALEHGFLDAIAVPIQSPDDPRIERGTLGHDRP